MQAEVKVEENPTTPVERWEKYNYEFVEMKEEEPEEDPYEE